MQKKLLTLGYQMGQIEMKEIIKYGKSKNASPEILSQTTTHTTPLF